MAHLESNLEQLKRQRDETERSVRKLEESNGALRKEIERSKSGEEEEDAREYALALRENEKLIPKRQAKVYELSREIERFSSG